MIADKKAEINILFSCYFNKLILAGPQISVNSFRYTFTLTLFPQIITVHLIQHELSCVQCSKDIFCVLYQSCISPVQFSLFKVTSSLAGHIIIERKIFFFFLKKFAKNHFEQLLVHFEFQCSSINLKINILIFFLREDT